MKPTIIFDLDATLNDMAHQIHNLFLHTYGFDLFTHKGPFPFTLEEMLLIIQKHHLHDKTVPLEGAHDLFDSIHSLNMDIGIITGRKCFIHEPDSLTLDWLKQHHLKPDWVEIILGSKLMVLQTKKVECLLFLDDEPRHLLEISETKAATYIGTLTYPYNENLPNNILTFKNLGEVEKFLLSTFKSKARHA